MPPSTACLSIAVSSSSANATLVSAPRLSSSWVTLLAPDQHRGHPVVAQRPGQRHLGQRLAARLGKIVQAAHLCQLVVGDLRGLEEPAFRGARVIGDAREVAIRSAGPAPAAKTRSRRHPLRAEDRRAGPPSTQRLNMEYDWAGGSRSGVPMAAQDLRMASAVRSLRLSSLRCRHTAPCPLRTIWSSAPMVSSSGVSGSGRCEVEDVDIIEAHAACSALVEAGR